MKNRQKIDELDIFFSLKKMERERAVSITVPYIEQKSLSIDRKIFIKYPCLFF